MQPMIRSIMNKVNSGKSAKELMAVYISQKDELVKKL